MFVPYRIVWWSRPSLTNEEEIEAGKQISSIGKEQFIKEFIKSAGATKYDGVKYTATQTFLSVVFCIFLFGWLFFSGHGPQFVVIFSIVTFFYLGSVAISTIKLNNWLNDIVAKYAAHVANGERI